jgi:hypothetical protein
MHKDRSKRTKNTSLSIFACMDYADDDNSPLSYIHKVKAFRITS